MRTFKCGVCGETVYFENFFCQNCHTALGFDPGSQTMLPLKQDGDRLTARSPAGDTLVYCGNHKHDVCNWLAPESTNGEEALCLSCSLNRTIPDLTSEGNLERWFEFEKAKRRLIYGLLRLGLPVNETDGRQAETPLMFDILANRPTGHQSGLITMNVLEADPEVREQIRTQFNEPYRTLLGHFRHEIGHYYWMILIGQSGWLSEFRELFGDDTADYQQALDAYHENGPDAEWQETHISAYATAHPWEDWAECWAHYLHVVDALETAARYGMAPNTQTGLGRFLGRSQVPGDPYSAANAKQLIDRWIPLALALNDLNRSMGHPDYYPFVISPPVAGKLDFIHRVIHSASR